MSNTNEKQANINISKVCKKNDHEYQVIDDSNDVLGTFSIPGESVDEILTTGVFNSYASETTPEGEQILIKPLGMSIETYDNYSGSSSVPCGSSSIPGGSSSEYQW